MEANIKTIEINGEKYIRESDVQAQPTGNRAVVVIDRGWIFAGDVTEGDGRIKLSRCVWLFQWDTIGLDDVLLDPKSGHADLRPIPNGIDIPSGSEIYRIPVGQDWGL